MAIGCIYLESMRYSIKNRKKRGQFCSLALKMKDFRNVFKASGDMENDFLYKKVQILYQS